MSVIEKLENYWRGVCDPRYGGGGGGGGNPLLHGKFDRASRRCQSSLNIHSHVHQLNKHNSLQRITNKQQQQQQQLPQQQHGRITSPCRVCEENRSNEGKKLSTLTLNRKLPGGGIYNNGHAHHLPTIIPGNRSESTTLAKFLAQSESKLCNRDDLLIESLEDRKSTCPDPEINQPYESVKMRLQKPEGRPKSLEYSQRNAWMRLYRDMELSTAIESANKEKESLAKSSFSLNTKDAARKPPKGRSKSIVHLHRLDSQSDMAQDNLDTLSHNSDDSQCSASKPAGSSLFQRFSKTFSLRFGNSSAPGGKHKKVKYPLGSSPDLYHRSENDNRKEGSGLKWRQSSLNSQREEKCKSGDSGIGIAEEVSLRSKSTRRNRRIKSENIDAILEVSGSSLNLNQSQPCINTPSSPVVCGTPLPHMDSPISRKLSLVEIPDHTWDDQRASPGGSIESRKSSPTASNELTKSYEDLLEAKLDDDGFVSSDEQDDSMNKNYVQSKNNKNSGYLKNSENINKCIDFNNSNNDGGIRGRVVSDILQTEKSYVKTLNDIVQGFVIPCRRRTDLFSSRVIENMFSNLEDILRLHARFLEALVSSLDQENLAESTIGHIFTLWTDEFDLYCDYCCNNPVSMVTIQNLTANPDYAEFFEACRRIQMMDRLPLHGFLLRPIQRICQYHLQLNELLKQTDTEHKDYQSTSEALDSMRKVAQRVNDAQRLFDAVHEITKLQNSMDLFEGPNLIDRNNQILHRGDLVKAHQGRKHKEVHVIVLNAELVICKRLQKDITKKNSLLFIGRIDLSHRLWHDIDGSQEDEIFGSVHNSWRVFSREKSCWVLFTTLTATEKEMWLGILEKTNREKLPPVDLQMRDRVKELIAQSSIQQSVVNSQVQTSYQNNTLPKSKKASKAKQSNVNISKVDSDAMLIEVGKLKRNNFNNNINNNNSSSQPMTHKERTSVFYV